MEMMVAEEVTFTNEINADLYKRYFGTPDAHDDVLESGSLVIADIDNFKQFNDRFGHQIGDKVLGLVAQRLVNLVKEPGTAARFGGEEFAIILPAMNLDRAAIVAEQIRQAVVRSRLSGKSSHADYGSITLSLGVAEYQLHEELGELIGRADTALYRAKRAGRNRVSTERYAPRR